MRFPVDTSDARMADTLLAYLHDDSLARLVIDGDLRILWANRAARSLLAEQGSVAERSGMLSFADAEGRQTLVQAFDDLPTEGRHVALHIADSQEHLIIGVRPIMHGARPAFAVHFHFTLTGFATVYADLRTIFALTRREHSIVLELLEGRSAAAIAERLDLSLETVRSHVRQAYAKLQVRSREQLFAKLQPYRIR